MANFNVLLEKAFDSAPYQKITSYGPFPMPRWANVSFGDNLKEGVNGVKSKAPECMQQAADKISEVAEEFIEEVAQIPRDALCLTRKNAFNYTRATNGLLQGIAFSILTFFLTVFIIQKKLGFIGITAGISWTVISAHHLNSYRASDRIKYRPKL